MRAPLRSPLFAWLPLAIACLLGACATERGPDRGRFTFAPVPIASNQVWPSVGEDIPRYAYTGTLYGPPNFIPEADPGGFFRKTLEFLAGLDDAVPERGLFRPQGGVVDGRGRILTVDAGKATLAVFDPLGGTYDEWSESDPGGVFASPIAVTVAESGKIFVSDSDRAMVAVLGPDGTPGNPIGLGMLKRPTGLAYDNLHSRLYVVDTGASDIKVFSPEGGLLQTIGRPGAEPGEFNRPTYLALVDDELFVADTLNARIQILNAESGDPVAEFGRRGLYQGQFVRPKGIAVDGEGHVYVADSYVDHLLVYDRSGRFLLGIGGTGSGQGEFLSPTGVWLDRGNRVYVSDMLNRRVQVFHFLGED